MSALAHWALQKALYEMLAADIALSALVEGIYDNPPENSSFPYIVFGECKSNEWSSATFLGQEIMLQMHVYSREKGKKETSAIMERLAALLHDADVTVDGAELIMLRVVSAANALEHDGVTYQGSIRCRALLKMT